MDAVEQTIADQPLLCMWEEVADESASLKSALGSLDANITSLAALIGPPGGFSEQEASEIREAGADLVTLGARVLRSETAAITVMSAMLYELGDLGR
jgi:16S rRNA (uracil1498-N3)-methyltransferase